MEGTFVQSGVASYVYWGPANNSVTGHGTCQVIGKTQINCSALMTPNMVQTNDPDANSEFDNIAQDQINSGTGCLLGAVRITTSLVPGAECTSGSGSGDGCCGGGVTCGLFSRRGGAQGEAGGGTICDPSTCGCEPASPIIIDTTGHGFHLTSPQ